VWHVPRSNWMRRESTGAHFTLKLANSGSTSVGRTRFKSPLAHQYDPRPDVGPIWNPRQDLRAHGGTGVAPTQFGGPAISQTLLASYAQVDCGSGDLAVPASRSAGGSGASAAGQPAARPPQAGALFTTARRVATWRLRADIAVNLSNGAAGLDASWSARWVSLGPSSYCCRSSEADVGRSRTVQFSRRAGKSCCNKPCSSSRSSGVSGA
jgi:hypothetical protein